MRRLGLAPRPRACPAPHAHRHLSFLPYVCRVACITERDTTRGGETPDHPTSRLDLCRAPPAAAPRPARACAASPFESMGGPPDIGVYDKSKLILS